MKKQQNETPSATGKVQMVGFQPYDGEDTEVIGAIGRDGFYLPWWFPWGPGGGSAMDKIRALIDSHLIDGEVYVTLDRIEEITGTPIPNIRRTLERQRLEFIAEGKL